MGKTTDALFRAARSAVGGDPAAALAEIEALFARCLVTLAELHQTQPVALREQLAARRAELEVLLRGVAMLRELSARTMDAIASHGERLATAVFTSLLQQRGVRVVQVDARAVVRTDLRFGNATPDRTAIRALAAEQLLPVLRAGQAVVTEGYIGAAHDGTTTTLGRGGSDYTAARLGSAVAAEEVQIWTDVEGVLTADPRVVPAAVSVPAMTFAEAAELAAFGAKVLHPATIQPAVETGVPVTVRHTLKPRGGLTRIARSVPGPRPPVTAIASRGPITVLTLTSTRMLHQSGYLASIFEVFGRLRVPVDLIATAEVAVSCSVEADSPIAELVAGLQEFAQVAVTEQRAIVAVVGEGLKLTAGLAARSLRALGDIVPELISMGGNDINLSVVVPQPLADEAVRRLHQALLMEADG
jgi:aspartate kinase